PLTPPRADSESPRGQATVAVRPQRRGSGLRGATSRRDADAPRLRRGSSGRARQLGSVSARAPSFVASGSYRPPIPNTDRRTQKPNSPGFWGGIRFMGWEPPRADGRPY